MNRLHPTTVGPYSTWRTSEFQLPLLSLNRSSRTKRRPKLLLGWSSTSIGAKSRCSCAVSGDESNAVRSNGNIGTWEDSEECVDVIVVGSRKDSVLDFCAASPFLSPALRFWNIIVHESEQVQLQHRFYGQAQIMSDMCGNCADKSQCTKKGYVVSDIKETTQMKSYMVVDMVMDAPVAAEHDKCSSCTCTDGICHN